MRTRSTSAWARPTRSTSPTGKSRGADTNLIGGRINADQTVLMPNGRAKEALIGTPTSGPFAIDNPDAAWQAHAKACQNAFPENERFPTPSLFGIGYCIATLAAIQGLNAVNGDLSDGQAKFREALASLPLETPLGTVTLNENRQASGSVFITEVVDDGEGGLTTPFRSRVDNVTQRLGMTPEEFRALGPPARDTPALRGG